MYYALSQKKVKVIVFNATFNNIAPISWRSVYWSGKPDYPEKTTDLLQVTDKLYFFFFFLGWMSFSTRPLVTSAPKQLQIINVLVYMLLCHGEDFKSSSKYNTCSIFFWIDAWMGTVAASGNSQLPCPLYWVCLSDTCCVSYVI